MKRVVVVALCVLAAGFVHAQGTPAPDAVIEKYLAAIGGRDALGKLTSRRSTGTVSVSGPAGDIPGQIELDAKLPNKIRVMMTLDLTALGAGQLPIEQRFDGTAGIVLNPMQGNSDISGLQLDSMRNNMFPTPLLTYRTLGMTLAPLAGDTIGGKTTVGLLLTPKSGAPVKLYFDPQTGLLLRTTTKISSPDLGELDQTSDVSDYRDVDGVKVPFVVVNTNPAQTVRVVLTRVEHNVALDDKLFGR